MLGRYIRAAARRVLRDELADQWLLGYLACEEDEALCQTEAMQPRETRYEVHVWDADAQAYVERLMRQAGSPT